MLRLVGRCVLPCALLTGAIVFSHATQAYAQQPAGNRPANSGGQVGGQPGGQRNAGGQAIGQRNAAIQPNEQINAQPPAPRQPDWFPLNAAHEAHLNEILKYWEYQAGQVQRYRCKFIRWEYEPSVFPINQESPVTTSEGTIQYAAPDKGLFKVETMWDAAREQKGNTTVPVVKDGKQQWVARAKEEVLYSEHWICDGKSIYEYRRHSKEIVQSDIPPDLQGSNITDGPLPFLFGGKANAMKARYWIHVIEPPNKKEGRFYLEAIPKRREEAADFLAIHIVIDEKEFLPEALLLFHLDRSHETFEFQNRETNWNLLTEKLKNPFLQQFYAPQPPSGWKIVKEAFRPGPPATGIPTARAGAPAANGPRQATQGPAPQRR